MAERWPAEPPTDPLRLGLVAVFVTALVTSQVIAGKVLALPVGIALVGGALLVPAGVLANALTFFASDCYTELYGRRAAHTMVNVAFLMNFLLLALIGLAIAAPGSPAGVDPASFAAVLGFSVNIVIGSLIAYLVSQHWDVFVFDAIGDRTGGRLLWVRNLGSTASSQLLDTVVFIGFAFAIVPAVIGIGEAVPLDVLGQLIVGHYAVKLVIAVLDTPFVYAVIAYAKATGRAGSRWRTP